MGPVRVSPGISHHRLKVLRAAVNDLGPAVGENAFRPAEQILSVAQVTHEMRPVDALASSATVVRMDDRVLSEVVPAFAVGRSRETQLARVLRPLAVGAYTRRRYLAETPTIDRRVDVGPRGRTTGCSSSVRGSPATPASVSRLCPPRLSTRSSQDRDKWPGPSADARRRSPTGSRNSGST